MTSHHLLEINLISAQDLKPLSGHHRRTKAYAVAWVDPTAKLRTRVDRVGGENPTWNDKFIFKVPEWFLHADSTYAVSVEIYSSGVWFLPDSLLGTVRLLIGNYHLLASPPGPLSFSAVGIRRRSGRFHGVLNVGAMLLHGVSQRTAEVLNWSPAVGYQDLMGTSRRFRRLTAAAEAAESGGEFTGDVEKDSRKVVVREGKGERRRKERGGRWDCGRVLCRLGFQRKIHLSPSERSLQILLAEEMQR